MKRPVGQCFQDSRYKWQELYATQIQAVFNSAQFHIVTAGGTYPYHWIKESYSFGSTSLIMTALTVHGSFVA
jgi:hypothetical protein